MSNEDPDYQKFKGDQDDQDKRRVSESTSNSSPEPILYRLEVVEEVCRICLNPGSIPIFGVKSDISSDLKLIASIDVTLGDGLPHNLCPKCQDQLDAAVHFRSIAQKSDAILRKKTNSQKPRNHCSSTNEIDQINVNGESDEDSEDGVYLEYAASDNDGSTSDLEIFNASLNDSCSIPETVEPDPEELKSLVHSFNKNARLRRCEVCDIAFRTEEQLNEHSSDHDSRDVITCEICKNIIQKYLYSTHLKLHKESYNERLNKKYSKIECNICGKHVNKHYMKKHIILIHGTDEENADKFKECTVCNKLVSKRYLTEHMKIKHMQREPQKVNSILRVKCSICLRNIREDKYKDHVAKHATSRKKYFCEECGREFASISSFATHTLTHKDEYKFKCQFCPYRGKHIGLLKVHVRTHTKDYAYKCEICNATFINKSNLSAHEKTHSSEAKFVCSVCGKCFTTERNLKVHNLNIHVEYKPFSCDICKKSYGSRQVLLIHKKNIHNISLSNSRIGKMPSYLMSAQESKVVENVP